jgi:hypothetical protein
VTKSLESQCEGLSRVFLFTMILRRNLPAGVSPQARASRLALYSTLARTREHVRIHQKAYSSVSPQVCAGSSNICCENGRPSLLYSRGESRLQHRAFSTRSSSQSTYHRSDFSGQGFSSFYETDQPTRGPLGGTSNVGQTHVTPKALRQHLDQFVVDQDRAKVVLSVAVHEHYLRNQENQRRKEEAARLEAQTQRRASVFRHPVEGSSNSITVVTPTTTAHRPVSNPTR